jgi:hypothetical protein
MESELSIINTKINQSKNKIAQTSTQIKKISGRYQPTKETKITTLAQKIEKNKEYISQSSNREMRKLDDVRAVIAFSKDEEF